MRKQALCLLRREYLVKPNHIGPNNGYDYKTAQSLNSVTNGIGTAKNNQDPAYILDLVKKARTTKQKS
jgi:hypothetical protein